MSAQRDPLLRRSRRRRHWRCAACGSLRLEIIAIGYTVGRVDPNAKCLTIGSEERSEWDLIDRSSLQCLDCFSGRAERVLMTAEEFEDAEFDAMEADEARYSRA